MTDPDEIEKVGKMRFVWPYKAADQKKMREKNPGGIVGNAAALVVVFADCSITEGRNHGELLYLGVVRDSKLFCSNRKHADHVYSLRCWIMLGVGK